MDEAIEDGVGDGGVGDDLVPVLDRHLAGDDGRAALMAVVDDLEEIAPLFAGERGEPPIVEDEEIDARQCLEEPGIASVAAGEGERFEQPRQAIIEDGTIVAAGLIAEGTGDPALSGSGRTSVMMPGVRRLKCGSFILSIRGAARLLSRSAASATPALTI